MHLINSSLYLTTTVQFHSLQKLKRRKSVISEASQALKWSTQKLERVNNLLHEDYMSSETSADESENEENNRNCYKVRHIPWLKKRYRLAFYTLDNFYTKHKMSNRSRKMTHPRVTSKYTSERIMPETAPSWAVKEAYRDDDTLDLSLNTSGGSESFNGGSD